MGRAKKAKQYDSRVILRMESGLEGMLRESAKEGGVKVSEYVRGVLWMVERAVRDGGGVDDNERVNK